MKIRAITPLTTVVALVATAPAWSQQANESVTTVVVTGSRIARPDLDNLEPTVSVTSERIEERLQTNIIDVLNEIPAFAPPTTSAVGLQGSSFGVAQSFSDFFGLGSQRTLTLVNGRRFVSSNTPSIFGPDNAGNQVDLNLIPTQLVERLDVVAVGGAPVYGADAIAGTVNFILKKSFEGFNVDTLVGQSARGDGENYRVRALAGTNFFEDRGNAVASLEFTKSKGLTQQDRARTRAQLFFTDPADPDSPFDQELILNRRVNAVEFGGIPLLGDSIPEFAGFTDAMGNVLRFAPDGSLVPFDFGTRTGDLITSNGGDGLNLGQVSTLLSPQERANATFLVNFKFTDNVRGFGEAWYANTKGERITSQPVFNTALFDAAGNPDGNLILSIDNPFLTTASRNFIQQQLLDAMVDDPTVFQLARANTDLQSGRAEAETDLVRFVAGVEGDLEFFGKQYQWEVSANYGRTETDSSEPQLVQQNFLNALDAVRDGNGNIVCRPGSTNAPIATLSSTCAPLNLFGLGAPSQAARDYITTIADTNTTISQRVFNANIGGPIFDLPAGSVQAVIGAENRRETSSFDPGAFFQQALGRSIPITGLSGEFETDEAFGEVLVPIFSPGQNIPGLHLLELDGKLRYVDHSIAGDDTTDTVGVRYAPVRDVLLRANSTKSIRSPAIQETFNPTAPAFATANDPCDTRFRNTGPNPAQRQANCAAAGLPANFQSNIVRFTSRISVSGNLNLDNEEADSETIGAVFKPRWVPNLNIAVDWIRIEIDNAITSLSATQVLEACFDSTMPIAQTPLCGNIDRDGGGQVTFVRTGTQNAAFVKFKGVQTQIDYSYDLGRFGRIGVDIKYFNLHELTTRVGSGDADHQDGELGFSKHQGDVNLNYQLKNLSASLQTQYVGKAEFDVDELPNARNIRGVNEWYLFNTSLGYRVSDNWSARLVLNNLFDTSPPFPSTGSTPVYFRGLLGRTFSASALYKF
jgi:outer membrane receptor protein involved in Fe transport